MFIHKTLPAKRWRVCCALLVIVFLFSSSYAHAQIPFGGFVGATFPGVCTASAPGAIPFYMIGYGPPLMMWTGVTEPPVTGLAILGFAAGFYPCLMWIICGLVPCPIPFPAHPGGMIWIFGGQG